MNNKNASAARRFGCTACGKCCDRGPEFELGEAESLAGLFVTSVVFKTHSIPLNERSDWAAEWWSKRASRIPLRPALEEARQHHALFAGHQLSDRHRGRRRYLDISAIAGDDGQGRCPALAGTQCSIYDQRPLTCRTVPLHYSRPPSMLLAYINRFAGTAGYACDTGPEAPAALDGNRIQDHAIIQSRQLAIATARQDRPWKRAIIAAMEDESMAAAVSLPSLQAVLDNANKGFATQLPMVVAWRVAVRQGIMTHHAFAEVCRQQARLVRGKLAKLPGGTMRGEYLDLLAVYQSELSMLRAE